jgi:hypothetical protein
MTIQELAASYRTEMAQRFGTDDVAVTITNRQHVPTYPHDAYQIKGAVRQYAGQLLNVAYREVINVSDGFQPSNQHARTLRWRRILNREG